MKNTCRILFIGNSHTYYNDMPGMLAELAAHAPEAPAVFPTMLAHGGVSLEWHVAEPEVRFNILYGGYDYIVLQQKAHPFAGEANLIREARMIHAYIRQTSSRPVVYMTWAEKSHPENQMAVTAAYRKLAGEIGAILAPVGLAWEKVLQRNSAIPLFDPHDDHAGPAGSYLVACVMMASIFGVDPRGLPERVGRNVSSLDLSTEQAAFLQKIAWETVCESKG